VLLCCCSQSNDRVEANVHAQRNALLTETQQKICNLAQCSVLPLLLLQVALTNCNISGGAAQAGGGLFVADESNTTLFGCRFDRNNVLGSGGGAFAKDAAVLTVGDSTFEHNTAETGGALHAQDGGPQLKLLRAKLVRNNACSSGGGVFAGTWVSGGGPNITVVEGECADNTASVSGGCLDITENTTVVLVNISLVNNTATQGGALAMKHFAAVSMTGGMVSSNRARIGAGVLLLQPAHLVVWSSVIVGNAAEQQGGGNACASWCCTEVVGVCQGTKQLCALGWWFVLFSK
jgi:predicted outer membrane repeat protein